MTRFCLLMLVAAVALSARGNAQDASRKDVVGFVENAIAAGEGVAAQTLLERYLQTHPTDNDLRELVALAAFHAGEYDRTVKALAVLAQEAGRLSPDMKALQTLASNTRDATKDFVHTSDGAFIVSHAPGADAALVPYALETLKATKAALETELGVSMSSPVRLEIYPNAESLAKVSTLSVDSIRRTGTIALCKWGRLMIASPQALLRGYPWLDTIAHEYVHLLVTKRTGDQAPVWLQEGLAKFLETRWRIPTPTLHLEPAARRILIQAASKRELLSFSKLHPSIALLPSQRDAALAFAQVSSFVEGFHAQFGATGLQRVLEEVASGNDAKRAVASVAGKRFSSLEASWKKRVRKMKPSASARLLPTLLKADATELDEVATVQAGRARKYLRLGDMLWSRSRPLAAATEYGKAHEEAPDDPTVSSRFARSALAGGRPQAAIAPLQNILRLYPAHAPSYSGLARAHFALGDKSAAAGSARRAIAHNPFDPAPHCILAASESENRERESRMCAELGGSPK